MPNRWTNSFAERPSRSLRTCGDWAAGCQACFDGVLCFAALHHLPGEELRARVAQQVRVLLPEGGLFIHSNWQFQHSPKLMARVQPCNFRWIARPV